ncbi:hypothetical protein CDAR_176051 [Caerostris darwini]|uniref:Uncharacterized protein n=1 Tax=Caerostris darwini TaxID=1538125 RepID=A0AAV4WMA3_9ARAC|nr:hypothetical protein CDAR_176051 [Caerostris darwini]
MAHFGEILFADPEPMEWEDALAEEPMDCLQAEEPMEWEETPLEVSQPSPTEVSLPAIKSQQPKVSSEGTSVSTKVRPILRARVPMPPKVQSDSNSIFLIVTQNSGSVGSLPHTNAHTGPPVSERRSSSDDIYVCCHTEVTDRCLLLSCVAESLAAPSRDAPARRRLRQVDQEHRRHPLVVSPQVSVHYNPFCVTTTSAFKRIQ